MSRSSWCSSFWSGESSCLGLLGVLLSGRPANLWLDGSIAHVHVRFEGVGYWLLSLRLGCGCTFFAPARGAERRHRGMHDRRAPPDAARHAVPLCVTPVPRSPCCRITIAGRGEPQEASSPSGPGSCLSLAAHSKLLGKRSPQRPSWGRRDKGFVGGEVASQLNPLYNHCSRSRCRLSDPAARPGAQVSKRPKAARGDRPPWRRPVPLPHSPPFHLPPALPPSLARGRRWRARAGKGKGVTRCVFRLSPHSSPFRPSCLGIASSSLFGRGRVLPCPTLGAPVHWRAFSPPRRRRSPRRRPPLPTAPFFSSLFKTKRLNERRSNGSLSRGRADPNCGRMTGRSGPWRTKSEGTPHGFETGAIALAIAASLACLPSLMRTQHSTSDTAVSGNLETCFYMGRVQQKLLQELLNPPSPSQLRLVTSRDLD
jgi:hypothetical protein